MRLAYDKAGAVRFSQNGKPVIRVAKEVSDSVKMVRDNFVANLMQYSGEVMTNHADEYSNQLAQAERLGKPIAQHDTAELTKALEAIAEAEAEANKEAEAITATTTDKELVTA